MLYPTISSLVEKVGNRYSLVLVVAKRARQLVDEMEEMGVHSDEKPVKLAVLDLDQGHLKCSGLNNDGHHAF